MKKYFLLNPLFYIIILLGITLIIQLISGAKLAFQVVEVYDSGLNKACEYGCTGSEIAMYPTDCYYYGGCLSLVDGKNVEYMEYGILYTLFIIFSVILGFMNGKLFWFTFCSFIVSYCLYSYAKSLDWFYGCSDGCGLENLFIYPIILPIIIFISSLLNRVIFKKSLN